MGKEIAIITDFTEAELRCLYPVLARLGGCCGDDPCTVEWYYPCSVTGGCLDRMTCGGCGEPLYKDDPAHSTSPVKPQSKDI